jgi:hypothetical protein
MAGTKVVRTEKTVRGLFGKIVKWSFVGFNLLMLLWVLSYCSFVGKAASSAATDAEKVGTGIGSILGSGMLLFIWMFGAVVLGIMTLLTRGKKIIVEETVAE